MLIAMQKCHLMYGTKYSLLSTEEEHDEDVKMLKNILNYHNICHLLLQLAIV